MIAPASLKRVPSVFLPELRPSSGLNARHCLERGGVLTVGKRRVIHVEFTRCNMLEEANTLKPERDRQQAALHYDS